MRWQKYPPHLWRQPCRLQWDQFAGDTPATTGSPCGCALQFFCATRWGLASSPSHDSVIPVTDEEAALDAASVLEWASEQVSPSPLPSQ
jgi:hypothetical protein